MTLDADIILPVTGANPIAYHMATMAIRTCRASTSARLTVLINNTPDGRIRERLMTQCLLLGASHAYLDGPFNIAKAFNLGAQMATGKYIAYATSDVIYYPNWLENIVELWEEQPEWFALCSYSFDDQNMPCSKPNTAPERRIEQTANPSSGVIVLKRGSRYSWDEQFPLWEIDADFLYYLESKALKAGCVLNARCDHLVDGVKAHLDLQTAFGQTSDQFYGESKARLKAKWGDRYKG